MKNRAFLFAAFLLLSQPTWAKFTYEGVLTDLSGQPLVSQTVDVRLSVLNPASNCELFQEKHTLTTAADGYFSVVVGTGSRQDANGFTLEHFFINSSTLTGTGSCTFNPVLGDERKLSVDVDADSTGPGGYDSLGMITIGHAPMASVAENVGGYNATNLVRVNGTAPLLTSPQSTELVNLVTGSSTVYAKTADIGTGANQLVQLNGSGFLPALDGSLLTNVSTSILAGNPVASGTPTVGNVLMWNGSNWASSAGATGTVTSVTSTHSFVTVTSSTTTPMITIAKAGASQDGYLASTDFTLFNAKLSTGTSFNGDVTGTYNSLALTNTGVASGTYFKVQVDPKGRVTNGAMLTSTDVTAALGYTPGQNILPNGKIFVGNGSSIATAVDMSGDVSISNSGIVTISNNSITSGKIADGSIGNADISGSAGISAGKIASGSITNAEFNFLSGVSSNIQSQLTSKVTSGTVIVLPPGTGVSPSLTFNGDTDTGIFSPAGNKVSLVANGIDMVSAIPTGVGINKLNPTATLHVGGTFKTDIVVVSSGNAVDASMGNTILFQSPIGSSAVSLDLNNMADGVHYTVIISDAANPRTYSFPDCTTAYFSPANSVTNNRTIYEIKHMGGGVCYIKWATNFN